MCAQAQASLTISDDDWAIDVGPGLGARASMAPASLHLQRPGAVVCVRRVRIGVFRLSRATLQHHGASTGPPPQSGWPGFHISRLVVVPSRQAGEHSTTNSEEQRKRVCHQLQQRLAYVLGFYHVSFNEDT